MSDEPDRTPLTTADRLRMYAAWRGCDDADFLHETADLLDAQAARIAELEREVRNLYDDMGHDHDAIQAGKDSHMQQAARIAALEAAAKAAHNTLSMAPANAFAMGALSILARALEANHE